MWWWRRRGGGQRQEWEGVPRRWAEGREGQRGRWLPDLMFSWCARRCSGQVDPNGLDIKIQGSAEEPQWRSKACLTSTLDRGLQPGSRHNRELILCVWFKTEMTSQWPRLSHPLYILEHVSAAGRPWFSSRSYMGSTIACVFFFTGCFLLTSLLGNSSIEHLHRIYFYLYNKCYKPILIAQITFRRECWHLVS